MWCAASTASSATPPDAVAFPRDEADVVALLDWCAGANVAALPTAVVRQSSAASRPGSSTTATRRASRSI